MTLLRSELTQLRSSDQSYAQGEALRALGTDGNSFRAAEQRQSWFAKYDRDISLAVTLSPRRGSGDLLLPNPRLAKASPWA